MNKNVKMLCLRKRKGHINIKFVFFIAGLYAKTRATIFLLIGNFKNDFKSAEYHSV